MVHVLSIDAFIQDFNVETHISYCITKLLMQISKSLQLLLNKQNLIQKSRVTLW